MKKNTTLSVLGRRTKQSIIDDAVHPSPSQTLSAPFVSGGGAGNYDPECTTIIPSYRNPCAEYNLSPDDDVLLSNSWGGGPLEGTNWIRYPLDGPSDDLYYFNQENLTGTFPFIEYTHGAPLEYMGVSGLGGYLTTPLWSYRVNAEQEVPFGPERLKYFGGSYQGSGIYLSGISEEVPDEPWSVLIGFSFSKMPENKNPANGIVFYIGNIDEGNFVSSGLGGNNRVEIIYRRENSGGTAIPDSLVVSCDGTLGPDPSSSSLWISNLEGCGGQPIQGDTQYYLRYAVDSTAGIKAKLWLASEPEPEQFQRSVARVQTTPILPSIGIVLNTGVALENCGGTAEPVEYQWDTPCLDFEDNETTLVCHALEFNPALAIGDPCDETPENSPGIYHDILIKKDHYWVPATPNVTEYIQVYFDGIAVEEGDGYWLDGLKLWPTNPDLFDDTVATAEVRI